MKDFATSSSPAVQAQLDRLAALSLPQGRIGLDAIRTLLTRLGDPQRALPPVFHVAGTNGKGSTCAFLRAMIEAQGMTVHATTSPHLVRYNERIRIAGSLVEDDQLAALLDEVLDTAGGLPISFFEATIAAAFLAFAREPADACVVEVGLGGRFDATNVITHPAACGIASLGMDHERFLLAPEAGTPEDPLTRIAFEKAGIAKLGAPLVTQSYPRRASEAVEALARRAGAVTALRGVDWFAETNADAIIYRDAKGELALPLPDLPGAHQVQNAALAAAMLRHQGEVAVDAEAIARGIQTARWPARLQRLGQGPLSALAPARDLWLDGGHNPDAGSVIAQHFAGRRLHLVLGMIDNKNPRALLDPLGSSIASLSVVPVPHHDCHTAQAFGRDARAMADVPAALRALPGDGLPVLIAGSLYLAGEVLRLNEETPD